MAPSKHGRFWVETVVCSDCKEKQVVHIRFRPQQGIMVQQEVECLKCHEVFLVEVPNDIIAGPFPVRS